MGDPAGEGEDAVTGDGEDETRGGDDGDCGVLKSSILCTKGTERRANTYKPQGDNADYVHEDMPSLSEDNGVEGDEWLRRTKREKGIRVRLRQSQYRASLI